MNINVYVKNIKICLYIVKEIYKMFRKRFVFNIVGEKSLVDKASLEIKNYISEITKEPVDIIMENKDTIFHKINMNNI